MLRREMTLGRVGSGGSVGLIRAVRVRPPGVACAPLVSRLPCTPLARRPESPFPVSRDVRSCARAAS